MFVYQIQISFFLTCFSAVFCGPSFAQSLSGVHLYQNIAKTRPPGATVLGESKMGPTTARKWRLVTGNELSATYVANTGRIVYLETDWNDREDSYDSGLPALAFGKTTLGDIRKKFGNNGFAFTDHFGAQMPDGSLVLFNSYGRTGDENAVVTFTTRLDAAQKQAFREKRITLADAVLVSVTVGDKRYLKTIWGEPSGPDADYKPAPW